MAMTEIGWPIHIPAIWNPSGAAPSYVSAGAMTAAANRTAYIIKAPKAGTLDWFEVRQQTNGNTPDNGLRFSFQTVDLTTGDPDGTQDQYRDVTTGFGAAAWLVPPGVMTNDGTSSGTKRTVTAGETLACVVEYVSFVAGDSVAMSAIQAGTVLSSLLNNQYMDFRSGAGTWAKSADYQPLALKYSDGTYGYVRPALPFTAINSRAFNSGSTPAMRGIYFEVAATVRAWGAWLHVDADAEFDVRLYNSSDTLLASWSQDRDQRQSGAAATMEAPFDAVVTLEPGNFYRLVVTPTTATNITIYDFDVNSAAVRQGAPYGLYRQGTTGTTGGWSNVDTTYGPLMGLIIDATDPAAQGGGTRGYFAIG